MVAPGMVPRVATRRDWRTVHCLTHAGRCRPPPLHPTTLLPLNPHPLISPPTPSRGPVCVGIFANFTFPKSCSVMDEVVANKFGGVDPYCNALDSIRDEFSAATEGVRPRT